ncbi:MAG: hypothetical protein ACJ716_12265 [Marmoricola sp.]
MRSLVLVLALALAGCGGSGTPAAKPSVEPTSLRQLDSATMRVVRVAFCDLVPKSAVRAALAAAPTRTRSWRNGDHVAEAGGQVGHEFGCAWFGPRSRVARAWVFARPVSASYATTLVRQARTKHGCTASTGKLFGTPSVVQTCRRAGSPLRVRHAGLFGDTWLTCEVGGSGTRAALRKRADGWCLDVANALNAG